MQEITAPLSTLPDDPLPLVSDVEFPVVLRGYDRESVDTYVRTTSQLVAELQATRSPEAAVRRALERVGEEVSGILQRAHETASRVTAQSRSEAEDRLQTARDEAAQIVQRAEDRLRELDAETDRIWAERQRIVEDTRDLARELLTITDSAAERFPAESGGEAELPGLGATAPAEIEAGGTDTPGIETPGIETVPPAPGAEAEEPLPEAGESDAEPTAILPVVEPAEAGEPAEGAGEPFEPVEWVEPTAEDAEEEHGTR